MPSPVDILKSVNLGLANAVNAAETVVGLSPQYVSLYAGQVVNISATVWLTAGTATTALVLRLRRGTTTAGALIAGPVTATAAAGSLYNLGIEAQDAPPESDAQQWCLTVTQTSGTAAGTTSLVTVELLAN